MKYIVTVARTEYRYHDFEIEADSPEEAADLGLIAGQDNDDWKIADVEQFVNEVYAADAKVVYSGR
jgi:hypothetical protein